MKPANIIYFGSPDFSAAILESIITTSHLPYAICGVVTSPDAPFGRKQIITPSPVAVTAAKYDLPIFKPEKLDDAHLAHLKLLKPDIFLVVSYGKIIPAPYLTTPTIGTFNIHFSLLPKYRGALPISEAIKNGDRETGVTLMEMEKKMDAGPIISAQKITIDIDDNVADLTTKLTQAAITLLTTQLPLVTTNYDQLRPSPQNDSLATHTPSLKTRTRQSAFIPWDQIKTCLPNPNVKFQISNIKCERIHALIRSLNPDPGAWTKINFPSLRGGIPTRQSIEIKILKTKLSADRCQLIPELVQLPGKSPISWESFLSGHLLP